jgi:hypothetical protein
VRHHQNLRETQTFKMIIEKIGNQYLTGKESDVIDFKFTATGLNIIVMTWNLKGNESRLEFDFEGYRGFRYLDEVDLMHYWRDPAFSGGFYHLYKILKGGWKSGEHGTDESFYSCIITGLQEFLIVTANGCINILAFDDPTIKEYEVQ